MRLLTWNARFEEMVFAFHGRFVNVDSPIPRPRPREQLRCDENKVYAADEVCFPLEGGSQTGFTLEEIFGRPVRGVCPVSQAKDTGQVHLKIAPSMQIDPPPSTMSEGQAHYILNGISPVNDLMKIIISTFMSLSRTTLNFPILLHLLLQYLVG